MKKVGRINEIGICAIQIKIGHISNAVMFSELLIRGTEEPTATFQSSRIVISESGLSSKPMQRDCDIVVAAITVKTPCKRINSRKRVCNPMPCHTNAVIPERNATVVKIPSDTAGTTHHGKMILSKTMRKLLKANCAQNR